MVFYDNRNYPDIVAIITFGGVMARQLDCLFINPRSSTEVYQELAHKFTAIEVPVWALLLAKSIQSIGFGAEILDCEAEHLQDLDAIMRIYYSNPRLIVLVVYGQNPNSGSANMVGAVRLAKKIKSTYPHFKIAFIGSHTSALPREVLAFDFVDFVFYNEGVYGLRELLATDLENGLSSVNSLGFKKDGALQLNTKASVVPTERMDIDLPGYAWELLPYKNKRLDLYRSHFWHGEFDCDKCSPSAALYTSLGCVMKCGFCMINSINRVNVSDHINASHSNIMRFWSPEFIAKEFERLVKYGVNTIRISDELFFLNKRYFEPLLTKIIEAGIGGQIRMWTYSRIDTVRPKYLELFRQAGVRWLALGVEAANTTIRREVTKGTFEETDIRQVIKDIYNSGIYTIANYIYGLPQDNYETMQQTLDLSIELNTEMMNCYACMALPGSPLYTESLQSNYQLPKAFSEWSFLSYDTLPMPTKHLTAAEVLRFRDMAWTTYFQRPEYLNMIQQRLGVKARKNIEDMSKIKLRRKLLGT